MIAASALDAAAACPHAETQLKLLYTAITRSCRTLRFAETSESPAGAAFFQWLQDKALAEPYVLMAAENDSAGEAMDYNDIDELRMRGLGLAAAAVSEESGTIKLSLLQKAAQCFSMAGYALPILCSRMDVCVCQSARGEISLNVSVKKIILGVRDMYKVWIVA